MSGQTKLSVILGCPYRAGLHCPGGGGGEGGRYASRLWVGV